MFACLQYGCEFSPSLQTAMLPGIWTIHACSRYFPMDGTIGPTLFLYPQHTVSSTLAPLTPVVLARAPRPVACLMEASAVSAATSPQCTHAGKGCWHSMIHLTHMPYAGNPPAPVWRQPPVLVHACIPKRLEHPPRKKARLTPGGKPVQGRSDHRAASWNWECSRR